MRKSGIAILAYLTVVTSAQAAEITLIAPGGIRAAIETLIPGFEKNTGHKVKAVFGSGSGTKERVIKGEPFDVPVVQPPTDIVTASGHVLKNSERPLASVAVGIAVKAGTPKPDISNADAVRKLLLGARAVAYPNPAGGAAAGASFEQTLIRLGIADAMKPKIWLAQGGRGAMEMLAKGEADIGLTFISEIITEPGVEVVGPLPRDISPPTTLVAFLSSHTKDIEPAKALVIYLSGEDAAKVYRAAGMEPGR